MVFLPCALNSRKDIGADGAQTGAPSAGGQPGTLTSYPARVLFAPWPSHVFPEAGTVLSLQMRKWAQTQVVDHFKLPKYSHVW